MAIAHDVASPVCSNGARGVVVWLTSGRPAMSWASVAIPVSARSSPALMRQTSRRSASWRTGFRRAARQPGAFGDVLVFVLEASVVFPIDQVKSTRYKASLLAVNEKSDAPRRELILSSGSCEPREVDVWLAALGDCSPNPQGDRRDPDRRVGLGVSTKQRHDWDGAIPHSSHRTRLALQRDPRARISRGFSNVVPLRRS